MPLQFFFFLSKFTYIEMYRSYLSNFDRRIHICNPHLYRDLCLSRSSTFIPPQSLTDLLRSLRRFFSSFAQFILPVLEYSINGGIQYGLFCAWYLSLSLVSMRFIHTVVLINSTRFIAKWDSVVEYSPICLSIHCWWASGLFPLTIAN